MLGRSSRLCAAIGAALLAGAGCAGNATRGAAGTDRSGVAAYVAPEHDTVTTSLQTALSVGRKIELLLSEPGGSRALPVIVYLPGLGEPASAGDAWRNAWASAGYAVVSLQPLAEDELAWRSDLARAGEFKALGRERYSASAMTARLDALVEIANEAARRSQAGESGWNRLDWNRVVIAGFDLGAYTALAWAGSSVPTGTSSPLRWRPRAIVALSPYASVPARAGDAAEADAAVPVLAVSGDADGDPLGVVEQGTPDDRRLDRPSQGDHYLLWMAGLTHARLSGSAAFDKIAEGRAGHGRQEAGANGDRRSGRRTREPAAGDVERGLPVRDVGRSPDGDLSLAEARERLAEAVQVSTAFLDAYVKDDERARAWLATSASARLGARGELRRAPKAVSPG